MNKKLWLATAALTAALVVGCDEGTTSKVEQKAADAAQAAGDATAAAADKAKEAGGAVADAAGAAADKAKDVAAQGFDAIKGQVEDLYNKAVKLVEEKKYTEAKGLVDQIMKWKDQLPADWQTKATDLMKKVEDGIKAMGGGN